MRGINSLAGQLMLWIAGTITLLWLVAVAFGAFVMREEFGEIFDGVLQETAERLVPLALDDLLAQAKAGAALRRGSLPAEPGEGNLTYQVRDGAGNVLLHSHAAAEKAFDAPLETGFSEGRDGRVYTASDEDGTIFVQVVYSADERQEAVMEGSLALLLPVLLIVPVTLLAVWFVVRRVLSPVEALRAAIGEKDGGNLAPIEEVTLPRELKPIQRSVNLLLARLRAVIDAEREFTSNSAHELRTPLAGALAQTQLLLSELRDGPAETRARQIEAALQRLTKLTEKLLQLARAEAGVGVTEATFDVADVVNLVVTDFQRASEDATRIRLHGNVSAVLLRAGNADTFAIVLRNLVENALLHGRDGEPVDIHIAPTGNVRIVNAAPVMSANELAALRKRFSRGKTLAAGSGLGLSIAERLLSQMRASLVLSSPAPGRPDGFQAEIVFPVPD